MTTVYFFVLISFLYIFSVFLFVMEFIYTWCFSLFIIFNVCGLIRGANQWAAEKNWPRFKSFGQISAVTVDPKGDVYVFHRGDRRWGADTFDSSERLANLSAGPIKDHTIVVLNPNGDLITATGRNLFYLPHGLTIDAEYNIWITDVGLHQVIKFPPIDKARNNTALAAASLTLGTALIPGKGHAAFCKPTSVAVDSATKDFFVADGYCNARIVKFDQNGNRLIEWGAPNPPGMYYSPGLYNLFVPHSLALDERRQRLMVADRENSRIMGYTTDGQFQNTLNPGGRVYGITYSPVTDQLYVVTTGVGLIRNPGMIISMKQGNVTGSFSPDQGFQNVHDVAVSPNGQDVYAVDLTTSLPWRFTVGEGTVKATKIPESLSNPLPTIHPAPVLPVQQEASSLGANQIAVSLVTAIVLLGIAAVGCHLYRRRSIAYPMEMRELILDDEDRNF